jgi:AcrR family transcriptional regulator
MSKIAKATDPRERILNTASELFYKQGYRATGINEVIKQSGVAKATFYNHFPAKDDLCLAYLELHSEAEKRAIREQIEGRHTAKERFMAVIETIKPWLEANDLRGCEYLNTVAEVPNPDNPLRRKGRQHYQWLREQIKELTEELIASDPGRYGKMEARTLTDDYMVILVGAIALCEVYHDTWPIKHAIKMVAQLID